MFNYIHIPFCRQKCLYCKFALTPRWQQVHIHKYLGFLKNEIRGFYTDRRGENIQSSYFGGGTPSVLSVSQIADIIDTFRTNAFSSDIEVTLEANPEDISPEFVSGIKDVGVNRLSLGIQTLKIDSLREIGRSNEAYALRALQILQESGFENVSVDFIIGLPKVGPREILSDIWHVLSKFLCIKHVSVYMLEEDTYPKNWKSLSIAPDKYESEFLQIRDFLREAGFLHYELSNFARPGYESRHNQSYWNHENYRGFGLAAASYVDSRRFTNATSFDGYYRGDLVDSEMLEKDQLRIEEMMFRFRTFRGIDVSFFSQTERLSDFKSEGYLREENGQIFLNSSGIFILDYIMGELL